MQYVNANQAHSILRNRLARPALACALLLLPLWAPAAPETNAAVPTAEAPAPAPSSATNAPAADVASVKVPDAALHPPSAEAGQTAGQDDGVVRNIRFQFDNIPYTDVLERFAQMTTKPLISDTKIEGTLTFNDPKPYSYQEALDTLNVILSMKDVMLVEAGRYLRLVPFKNLPQMALKIFRGLDNTGDVRPGEIVTVVLELKHLDGSETAKAATPMLSAAGSIAPLSRGRGLIITDRLANIERVRKLLAEIDTESSVDRQMKTYTLLHSSGAVVTELINKTFGSATAPKRTVFNEHTKRYEEVSPDPNDYVTAVFDEASRTLVLYGPGDRISLAEELIKRFEDKEGAHAGEVKIFYPQTLKADELARMVREAVPGVAAPNESAATSATKARLIIDRATNRLIVTAPIAGQLDSIEQLIRKVDADAAGSSSPLAESIQVTKVFRLQTADPATVSKVLTDAFTPRTPAGSANPTIKVTVDDATRTLVVTGSPGDVQHSVSVVEQLDSGIGNGEQETRFIDLGSAAEVKRLSTLVQQLYRDQVAAGANHNVPLAKILADPDSSRLIVTGSPEHLRKIEDIVQQLRKGQAKPEDRQLGIIELQNARLDSILKSLNELVNERMDNGEFKDLPKPFLLPDSANNRLLVTSTASQLAAIQDIVSALDVGPEQTKRDLRFVPLHTQTAADIIPLVTQLLASLPEQAKSTQPPKIMADPSGKQLLVLATAQDFSRIEGFVQQLEGNHNSIATRQLKAVELHSRKATEMVTLVQQLYQEQLKGQPAPDGGPATVMAEEKANRLMISGSTQEIARVETIIQQLDPAGAGLQKEETRVIRLHTAIAADLVGLVEKSLNNRDQKVQVLLDARSNSLILTGEHTALETAAQVIQQLDASPNLAPREMRIIELKSAESTAITPVVSELFSEMIRDQRGPAYVSPTKITADPAGNRIIVTGAKDEIEQVAALVAKLDQPPQQPGGARVFKLKNARAGELASVISNAMTTYDGRRPVSRVSVSADETSNSLVISGSRADLQDAAVIVEQLDGKAPVPGRALKVVDVTTANASQLANLARQVLAEQMKGRSDADAITITPEPSGRRLVVLAPPDDMEQVQKVIASLDAQPDQARDLHVIEIKDGSASSLLPLINQVYREQNANRKDKPASVMADGPSRLVVLGSDEDTEAIRKIAETLQNKDDHQPRQTRIFDFGQPDDAQRILQLARQLYQDQVTSEPALGRPDAQFMSDYGSGRIIVSARQNHLQLIEKIFNQLQDGQTILPPRQTQSFEVGQAEDVRRLLPLVQQLYREQWKDHGPEDPADAQILGDEKTGRLIVTARPNHIARIKSILDQLGPSNSNREPRDTRVYDLEAASAPELARTVQTLFEEQMKSQPGSPSGDTLILPDVNANRLIVSGGTNQLAVIDDIVKKLDKVTEKTAGTRVFKLTTSDSQQVAGILSSTLVRVNPYGRTIPRVSVGSDTRRNVLIVSGDPKDLQAAQAIIDQLESVDKQQDRQMKVLHLQNGSAAAMSDKVRQLYLDQVKSQGDAGSADALILPDETSNQLLVAASSPHLKLIEDIVGQLEKSQPEPQPRVTRLFPVGRPEEVQRLVPLVQQLYREQWKGKNPGDPADAQILPDAQNNRLIVTARPTHMEQIAGILEQLQSGGTNDQPALTRVYDLNTASASDLAQTVRTLYQEQLRQRPSAPENPALILPDATSNRLIISGASNEVASIEAIVTKLDQVTTQTGRTRVFKLKHSQADQIANILSTAMMEVNRYGRRVPRVSVGADNKSNVLIVSGEPQDIQSAAVIIEQLDTVADSEPRHMEVLPVQNGTSVSSLANRIKQLYLDQMKGTEDETAAEALILGDDQTQRLIVTATDSQLAVIKEILGQLQTARDVQGRDTRVYDLTAASAPDLAQTVRTLYEQQLKGRSAPQTEQPLILPDAASNRLVVSGPTNEVNTIEGIIEKLDKVSAQTAGTRVFKLKNSQAEQVASVLSSAMVEINRYGRPVPRVSVGADSKSNLLIVSGEPKDLQSAAVIIEQLDSVNDHEPRHMEVLPVQNGTAVSSLASRIKELYLDQMKGKGDETAADALILGDEQSQRLIVTATDAQLGVIKEILGQLQAPQETEGHDTRVFDLTAASAPDLAQTVRTLYEQQLKGRSAPLTDQPLILPDTAANRLVVSGPTNEVNAIQAIVEKLDKVSAQTAGTRVFKLKSSEAEQVAAILSTSLVEISRFGRPVPRVSVGADNKSNILIVSGEPKDLQAAAVIIEQLDNISQREPRQLRIIPLEGGQAEDTADRVKQLYLDQMKGQPDGGAADALIMGDNLSNRLIITANANQMKIIEAIVQQLQEAGAGTGRQLRVFMLQRGSASSVATMLSQLFTRQARRSGRSAAPSDVVITASPDDKTVIVDAGASDLDQIEKIVKLLDSDDNQQFLEVRTYQLKDSSASELAPNLSRLFTQRGRRSNDNDAPRFEADANANILIVAARHEQFEQIDGLIKELQSSAEIANEIKLVKLQYADPQQLLPVLESMVQAETIGGANRSYYRYRFRGQGNANSDRLRVAAAPALSALVLQGPPDKMAEAENMIHSLDKEDPDGKPVIQTVHLKKAQADTVAQAINQTFRDRGEQNQLQRANVTAVSDSNSLLISGPAAVVEKILKIIQDLDQESTSGDVEVRIYKLENGEARELSTVLNQLLQGVTRSQLRGRGARFIPATIAVDERSNSLIISGTPSHFQLVEEVLPTLDRAPTRSDRDVQVVWLENAQASDVALKLQTMYENAPADSRPVIESDIIANSITIIARKKDLVEIQNLINQLDASAQDNTIQVRLIPVDRVPAEQMASMLQNIFPQMSSAQLRLVDKLPTPPVMPGKTNLPRRLLPNAGTNAPPAASSTNLLAAPEVVIAVDKTANAILASGPTHELDRIDNLIFDLSLTFISSDAEFRQFPLKEADPVNVAKTLTELFREAPVNVPQQQQQQRSGDQKPQNKVVIPPPKVTVVADPRSSSVIVRAKPTDFILLESLIKQLDAPGISSQLEFRLVPLTNAQPDKVLPIVEKMIAQLGTVRPGEPVTVTADPRSHGIMVVARENILNQVEKMITSLDTPSSYAESEVLLVPLKQASAPQLASILQTMLKPGNQGDYTPEARELQDQVRRLKIRNEDGKSVLLDLTKPINIMADPSQGSNGGNRLILASTPDNLAALQAVVKMMDTVPTSEGVSIKIYHLENADATSVSQTLSTIFQQAKQFATGPAGNTQPEGLTGKALVNPINVAVDLRSNSLILGGRKETLDLAQRIVEDLDRKVEHFVTEVRLFHLKHASATHLAPLLQSVFAESAPVPGTQGLNAQLTRLETFLGTNAINSSQQPRNRAALTIQADETTNILIVGARHDVMPLIEDVINTMDIPAASGMDSVRIYPLEHADAATLQRVLANLYNGANSTRLRQEDKPNVTVDERTNALIVSGNEKAFAIVASLLKELDKEIPVELQDIQIIPLENADATDVASSLQKLLDARLQQRGNLGKQEAASLKVIVIGDPRTNSLLVGGSKENFELVKSLASQLDAAGPALSGRIRIVPLTHADARSLSLSLTSLFRQRYQASRSPDQQRNRPIIVADPRSNSLLVAAGVEDNRALDELVAKLDQKNENPAVSLHVLPLVHNDATQVAAMIERLFAARLRSQTAAGQQPSPTDEVSVEPDPLSNALVISASNENLDLIKALLQEVDQEPVAVGGTVQAFTLEHADAQRAATMIRSLVTQGLYRPGAQGGTRRGGRREALAVTVDPRSNTLIVSASPENMAVVRELIKNIDSQQLDANATIRLYPLKHARASHLATVLEQFFRAKRAGEAAGGGTERSVPVTVTADDRTGTLLVTGSQESFAAVDRMIEQLDSADVASQTTFKVFPLQRATATKVQDTLTKLFVRRPAIIKGEPPEPITVVADPWANAIIVGASPEDLLMATSLIERLDAEQAEAGIEVQILPLAKADAQKVAQTIMGLFRGAAGTSTATSPVSIHVDERLNALVVSAGQADGKRIAELVKKLDTEQVARVSEIRIFPLQHARATELASILTTALNTKPQELTDASPNRQSLLQFITRTDDGKELIASALKEGVLITADPRMNSLIVSAPLDYMNLLQQLVERLDASSPQHAQIKVFSLKNADARQMADLLLSLFRLQPAAGPGNSRSIQYTLVKPASMPNDSTTNAVGGASATLGTAEENALTVTVDPRTNSLLIGGTEHYVELASEIIIDLDSSPAQERETEVYRLRNSQATEVQTAVRSFLDQDRERVMQVLGQDAVGTAQRLLDREVAIVAEPISNTLLLSASPRYFTQIKELIEELDQPQSQVLIQVLLAEVSLDATTDLGVEWTYTTMDGNTTISTGTDFGVADDLQNFGGFSSAVTGGDYRFLLRALENEGRLEVLSRPQILTADNQPAEINIGQRVPFITTSQITDRGTINNTVQYQSVGVNLSVTPRISPDGFVKMDVGTTNSALTSSSVDISPGVTIPIINERRATTTVSVQSGQSIIIGGLISTTDDSRVKKIPYLGDIPYVGALFRSSKKVKDRKELLIILTPQILVQPKDQEARITRAKDITREQLDHSHIKDQIERDELQKELLRPIYPNLDKEEPSEKPKQKSELKTGRANS